MTQQSNNVYRKLVVKKLVDQFNKKHPRYTDPNYKLPDGQSPSSLKNVDLSRKEFNLLKLDTDLNQSNNKKSLLCGTVFGDTSMAPYGRTARMQCKHSTRQSDWFLWKWLVGLKQYLRSGVNAIYFSRPDGFQKMSIQGSDEFVLGKLKIASNSDASLLTLHSILIKKGKKTFARHWLNHMNTYFLMALWLDDGSLMKNRQGVICLDLFPREQQQILVDYLNLVWKIKCHINIIERTYQGSLRKYPRIFISDQESLLTYLRLIAPIVPVKTMIYKILFVPTNNIDLLQRWASECESLVLPEFKPLVRKFYEVQLKKYTE